MARKKELNFLEEIEEKYGKYIVDVDEKEEINAISTGSVSLDVSLGVGGIPLRRFTEIYGAEASGKTTLAISTVANALKLNHKVLYVDVEQTLDMDLVKAIIGDFDREKLLIVKPKTAEESMDISEKAIQSGEFNLIVLDSIGSLAPKKVLDDELTDANVALIARLMTTFTQRNAWAVKHSNLAFVGINQVRDRVGSYIKSFETPGGHNWKHVLSVKIQLSKAADIIRGGENVGINTKFVVKKNKVSPPFRTFLFPIIFGKGIELERDAVEFAKMLGVVKMAGSYYMFEGENLGQGLDNTIEHLKEDKLVLDKIINSCYNSVNNIKIEDSEDEDLSD